MELVLNNIDVKSYQNIIFILNNCRMPDNIVTQTENGFPRESWNVTRRSKLTRKNPKSFLNRVKETFGYTLWQNQTNSVKNIVRARRRASYTNNRLNELYDNEPNNSGISSSNNLGGSRKTKKTKKK